MILILGENTDTVTDTTIDWLNSLNIQFVRTNCSNGESLVDYVTLSDKNTEIYLKINQQEYKLSEFSFIWSRRGYLDKLTPDLAGVNDNFRCFNKEIHKHLLKERETMLNYIYTLIRGKPSLNNPLNYNINKLSVLHEAKNVGLKIPKTLITCNKAVVEDELCSPVINKNIQDLFRAEVAGKFASHNIQKYATCEEISEKFYYSLFQEEVRKMYELRIFFLGEKYFPMAIFSQGNRNTEVDYRHYDEKKENRAVPYVLPNDLENKLKRLMMKIGLNSGSIDIIVDDNYDYIFLEVNPVGQFEWLSANCNYFIEREIAKYIVDERENDK